MSAELSDITAAWNGNKWSFGVTLERTNLAPLDKYSWWPSVAEASAYAKGTLPAERKIPAIAYPGQLLTVAETSGVAAYLVTNNYDLMKLASGGNADELNTALQAEINARTTADTYISSQVSSLPADIDQARKDLSVTVEEQAAAEDGFLKTYVIKQGTEQVGAKINIPKDFLVKSASVETCIEANKPEDGYAVGDKYIDFVINSKDSEGEGDSKHMYVKVTDLVDVYAGYESMTIKTEVADGNAIKAEVKDGAITAAKLDTTLSAEISSATAGVAANAKAIETAKTELKAYADKAEADALSTAKADAASKIASLTANVDAGKAADNKQQFFTKITQTNGMVAATAAVIQASDVNGLEEKVSTAESNAKTYVDNKINALDVSDVATSKKFVTAVSQTDGLISVTRSEISLDDLSGDIAAQLEEKLAGKYDAAGSADAAQTAAEKTASDALAAAKVELTGLVSSTSAETLVSAKSYSDAAISALRTDLDSVSSDVSGLSDSVVVLDTRASTMSTNIGALSTFAETTLSNAITAEASRATAAENAITADVAALSGSFKDVSADHESRLTAAEGSITSIKSDVSGINDKLKLVENAMHFRGVIQLSDVGEDEISAALNKKYPGAIGGDVVVYTSNGTEYVYADGMWHELGDETNHASKASLQVETDAREAADAALSGAIDKKIYIDGVSATSLSVQNISRDDYRQKVLDGTVLSNVVYVVSADMLNMYGEKITNLLSGTDDTDAATVGQVNAAKAALEAYIASSKISAYTLNGATAEISDNAVVFEISCIDCGGASDD